jgi:hypothetical protein
MGRFAPKFTQDQRQAVARLLLDDGITGVEIVAAAADGIDSLEPFEISRATVYDIATKERRRREQDAVRAGDHTAILNRVHDVLDRELANIEKRQRHGAALDRGAISRLKTIHQTYSHPTQASRETPEHPKHNAKPTKLEVLVAEEQERADQAKRDREAEQATERAKNPDESQPPVSPRAVVMKAMRAREREPKL